MRLESIEAESSMRTYAHCNDYKATFVCGLNEAMDLQSRGFFTEYKAVIVPNIKREINCAKPHDIKVIFNPPATILYMNGKKYISKAYEEDFDEEKGLLMCLAKANGISHLELKRMIKNAKRPKK